MMRTGSSPGGQRSAPPWMWWLPALAMAAATAVAATQVPGDARSAVIWCGVVGTAAVALTTGELSRRGRALEALRSQYAEHQAALQRHLHEQEAATVRLAKERLPEAVEALRRGEFAENVVRAAASAGPATGLGAEFEAAHHELVRSVVEAVRAEESLRDSAQRGVVNIARRVQAIVHRQATDLREMEERHGQSREFFADLLRLDHSNALISRLADTIAVLGGARPGRQWSQPVPLYSVLRGAMSRIADYQRVSLHSVAEVAVMGRAVEPLIHALAELLDNATCYSPPQTRVHLTAGEVHAGIAVEIEDGGFGLSEEARTRAEHMLETAREGIDLNDLGEAPRLGLTVVGRLAQEYDFQVSLAPSAYGGVRAVLVVPHELITTAPASGRAHGIGATSGQRPADRPAGPVPPARKDTPSTSGRGEQELMDEETPQVAERTASGLPQRRSRRGGRSTAPTRAGAPAVEESEREEATSHEPAPGMWMGAFQEGLSGKRSATTAAQEHSDKSSDEGE
ncbi:ATP-binding protein [Streptomyces tubbatahanensis]|uniref:histidine kinase n=1 Tax=Streptomyces tubbatahanensis TaxID=2923272 RepID=A0ABY3XLR7_9ACTN|nr:ATP-binding protein [Streptomyces tubbatahanensis]UNS95368.1 ATP-binding protein [Streptomyces tubbatahanensis]